MPSGEQVQASLREFARSWKDYAGTERSEAQTFLNELMACYGTDRRAVGADFEVHPTDSRRFMDLHWPQRCIVEMKAPARSEHLSEDYSQVHDYWLNSADEAAEAPAARYVVLCSFHRFEVWEPGAFPLRARASFTLEQLPERYEALAFLTGPGVEASFVAHHRALTAEAAATLARLFESLSDRGAAPVDEIQRFTMQVVWTLFAEDLSMLSGYPLSTIVAGLRRDPERSPAAEIGHLFTVLNQKSNHHRHGVLAGTRHVNGELFARPAAIDLNREELDLLGQACQYDWRRVEPTIFGSLLEGVLGRTRRWTLGAHYTHEVDILKIVTPTIVTPWRARIAAVTSPAQGRALLDELCAFTVLDPAVGCGNFLYIAYRELRALEHQLKARITALAGEQGLPAPVGPWPYYPLGNLHGLDIENVAVLIARVTLWMGHRQMIELYGEAEAPLPLVDLSSIARADALRTKWPVVDCIIGNPPFLGDRNLRRAFGDAYLTWLEAEFKVGIKDHCVYWFRKAHDHLAPGQRAGLVGTNSISQNRARSTSLEYITANGGVITDAYASQRWPGEAKVHVSLVAWVKQPELPPAPRSLDGVAVAAIGPDLRADTGGSQKAAVLSANAGIAFYGPIPIGKGFIITKAATDALIAADERNAEVVRPFLTGADLAADPAQGPRRWCIDFATRTLEEASRYTEPLAVIRRDVKPDRDESRRITYRQRWWLFGEPCGEMRAAIAPLPRHIVCQAIGKRPIFAWSTTAVSMNNQVVVFALDQDYHLGVLTSRAHTAWATAQGSTHETRPRYTPSTVFATFPWPDPPTSAKREKVAQATRDLLQRREAICQQEDIGLTDLYNGVDDGKWSEIKTLHRRLDVAVAACYGWPAASAQDEPFLVSNLHTLNQQAAVGARAYAPFEQRSVK